MARQLMFYENAAPVNSEAHRDLCIKAQEGYGYAAKAAAVPLTAAEFAPAASEYAIVFAGEGDALMPMAVLGVQNEENSYVDADGAWDARYVPGFVRRYPFVFADGADDGQLVLFVDEDFAGCNRDGKGERLFDADGNQTSYLEEVLKFLQDYQNAFTRTRAYCKRLNDLDLLRPVDATFNLADGQQRTVRGFQIVDREKLKSIDAETLEVMFRTDELECTYLHLASLRNLNDLAQRTQGVETAEGQDVAEVDASDGDA